jgi:hypothetical protein
MILSTNDYPVYWFTKFQCTDGNVMIVNSKLLVKYDKTVVANFAALSRFLAARSSKPTTFWTVIPLTFIQIEDL